MPHTSRNRTQWSALAPLLADVFTDDDDPNGEHDFGSIVHQGKQIFLEDRLLRVRPGARFRRSERPDEDLRVLTIMLSDEY